MFLTETVKTNVTQSNKAENEYKPTFWRKVRRTLYLTVKTVFDYVFSFIAAIFLIPLILFVKIIYLATGDKEPILYAQKRNSKNGRIFNLYKFRTMVPDSDEKLAEILANDEELAREYSINKKLKNDPRVTRAGRLIRRTSLDEFPQFINVLKGDMSVIGNRPYLPQEKADMGEYYGDIVKTKCGIASYWAVNGRSKLSFEKRLELERYYSNHQSLRLDTKIFFKVIKVTIIGEGAK